MRAAYLRALNYNVFDFKLHQCNSCGTDNNTFGTYALIDAMSSQIKIWYCDPCSQELEYA